jgi:hypothetical protein
MQSRSFGEGSARVAALLAAGLAADQGYPSKPIRIAGAELRPGSPADFGKFIGSEKARWAKVVKESGEKFE